MTLADVYARISDDREGSRKGVDKRQVPDCLAFCGQRSIDVGETLVDNDLSASKGKRRPAYEQLYDRVKAGAVGLIVVWHLDRLYRTTKELEALIDLVEATQVRILSVSGGDFDLNTSDGRAMARVVVAMAQKESEDKSRRIKRKHRELAEAGLDHGGGHRPFGYEEDRVTIRADEHALALEAATRVLANETIRAVCADWNRRGIPTVNGVRWSQSKLRRTLTSPRNGGFREHEGNLYPGTWPPLFDDVTHMRLRRLLLDPARRKGHGSRSYLLTAGLSVCGRCGVKLVARPKDDGRRAYVCASGPGFNGCGKIACLAEPLEAWVTEALCSTLDSEYLTRPVASVGLEVHYASLHQDEAHLAELAAMLGSKELTKAEWSAARGPVLARMESTRRLLARHDRETSPWIGKGEELADEWDGLTFDQQRAVVGQVVDKVVVGPAVRGRNFFDPARVSIEWNA